MQDENGRQGKSSKVSVEHNAMTAPSETKPPEFQKKNLIQAKHHKDAGGLGCISAPPHDLRERSSLQIIDTCLSNLTLHQYIDTLKDMSWAELVELDDRGLKEFGIIDLGARRQPLKVFEQIKGELFRAWHNDH